MRNLKKIKSALISVYNKDGLDEIIIALQKNNVKIFSTGGTQKYIEKLGVQVNSVEDLTSYPSILGGRVKTLHPKVFGGILSRRENENDKNNIREFDIPEIDLVVVDLYPFEETVKSGANHQDIIEKIDIGGISLIRAAAKNYNDVVVISSKNQYKNLLNILNNNLESSIDERKKLAMQSFNISSNYDTAIFKYFNKNNEVSAFKESILDAKILRYGENPHQKGLFYGNFDDLFIQLHGKEISYNNLLDIDAAVNLINEFDTTTFVIMKHNNACGLASRDDLVQCWKDALAGDPISAFGGVIITNKEITKEVAAEMNSLFMEVVMAPSYTDEALEILKSKKNRVILIIKDFELPKYTFRTALNGVLWQEKDNKTEISEELKVVTKTAPTASEVDDLLFAIKIVKNTKSNTIVLAKNRQLIASGTGQTSRVDALRQAIAKAKSFGFDLNGAVLSSDAFFPFGDSVEIAHEAGITAVVQPGGSIRDKESIDFCNDNGMSMVFTGIRHFKH